jgi:DNA-directed RNA polymerase beta' subunit
MKTKNPFLIIINLDTKNVTTNYYRDESNYYSVSGEIEEEFLEEMIKINMTVYKSKDEMASDIEKKLFKDIKEEAEEYEEEFIEITQDMYEEHLIGKDNKKRSIYSTRSSSVDIQVINQSDLKHVLQDSGIDCKLIKCILNKTPICIDSNRKLKRAPEDV